MTFHIDAVLFDGIHDMTSFAESTISLEEKGMTAKKESDSNPESSTEWQNGSANLYRIKNPALSRS